ncbi:hypothetical protein AVEN_223264-1 [Araneus ventricosus]|uniref:Reverse transcriptase RNase H-like domain-containing protein n=1 Tax=Araneus ventricosus TaxID=182803 RepID=A0A4Y2NVW0_ARAVE|nr:hypothetical protein AVEN_223264-1 [Araneus ventricosus]
MCPYPASPKPKHNTVHRIITNGQPVFSRPRHLNPKQLAIAKQEFQTMMEQGICRPSKSNWSNPLHMVPKPNGEFRPTGAALYQIADSSLQPLGFFTLKLTETEKKHSAYDRKLLAAYSAIKHFRFMLEDKTFVLHKDHKLLTYAFMQKSGRCSPQQLQYLDFMSQLTTDIRHVKVVENIPAGTLSRVEAITCPTPINYQQMAEAQGSASDLQACLASPSSAL